jgi:hypothetical protein
MRRINHFNFIDQLMGLSETFIAIFLLSINNISYYFTGSMGNKGKYHP